jgi:agmatinase
LFHVIPVPYEASVSYGRGTANGPAAILRASDQLELWDGESVPADLGLYTLPAVACEGDPPSVLARIAGSVRWSAERGAVPVLLGGEHTITYGAVRALHEHYGTLGLIQIDAHADLRDSYDATPWSHACVMRRVVELGLPLAQFGVRALCREEIEARKRYGVLSVDAPRLVGEGAAAPPLPRRFPSSIYLSFDVDGLDSSIMPATGTPVPGGLDWYGALGIAARMMRGRRVVGMDVVEFAPIPGLHAFDFTAARLTYALMGLVQRCSRRPQPREPRGGKSAIVKQAER